MHVGCRFGESKGSLKIRDLESERGCLRCACLYVLRVSLVVLVNLCFDNDITCVNIVAQVVINNEQTYTRVCAW